MWTARPRPCGSRRAVRVSPRCGAPAGGRGEARTFQIAYHHYALVPVTGLAPGTTSAYEVLLDGTPVWPLPDSSHPPSEIRTPAEGDTVRVAFGSCRWAAPPAA